MYPNTIAFFKEGNGGRRESHRKSSNVERWYGERETKGGKKIRKRKRECVKQEGYTTLIKRHTNETNQLYNGGAGERAV